MKTVTILCLLLFLTIPAFGELTKEDVRTIMKEEITASEKRLKEYIDLKIDAVDQKLTARIDGVEKSLNARIDGTNTRIAGLDKRMDNMWRLMMGLFGLVAATIAIPQIIIAYRDRGRKEMQSQIDQLRKELEAMQQ